MKNGEYTDKGLIVDILTQSFEANQSVNYIIKQDEKRIERIRALMDYSIDICHLFGEVWLSDDKKACALILYPHLKRTTFKSIYLDVKLILSAIGISSIKKTLEREAKIKKKQPKEKMAYLWFIGVDPQEQQKGSGSLLLQQVLVETGKKNLPVYLETSTLKNLPWYGQFDFQVYDKLELSYTLYFLKRVPAK